MKKLTINVSSEFLFENHNVNANEEGRPKEANGKVYISGNKTRFMIFEKMKDYVIENGVNTQISTGDSLLGDIVNDIRSDLGGYMITTSATKDESTSKKGKKKGKSEDSDEEGEEKEGAIVGFSEKRVSPLKVAFSFSREKSDFMDDLFVCFANTDDKSNQRINTKFYSIKDVIDINSQLNIDEVGRKKTFTIVDKKFVQETNELLITQEEKMKRLELYLKSVGELKGLANYSRNATNNTPNKIFISFAENRRFVKFFQMSQMEQTNYLRTLEPGSYFIGDDNTDFSVNDAITASIEWLNSNVEKLYI